MTDRKRGYYEYVRKPSPVHPGQVQARANPNPRAFDIDTFLDDRFVEYAGDGENVSEAKK